MSNYEFIKKIGLANTDCESLGNMVSKHKLVLVARCSSSKCNRVPNSAKGKIIAKSDEAKKLKACPNCKGILFFEHIKDFSRDL